MKIGQYQEGFLIGILLALSSGIFIAADMDLALTRAGLLVLPLLLLAAIVCILKNFKYTWLLFLALFFLLGAVRYQGAAEISATDIANFSGSDIKVTGILIEPVRLTTDSRGETKARYTVDVTEIKQGAAAVKGTGGLYIYAKISAENSNIAFPQIGDKITASGTLRVPRGYKNPGQLDTNLLLKSQGISGNLSCGKRPVKIEPQEGHSFMRWIFSVRAHYLKSMEQVMPKADAAAIFAMLFGGYEGINEQLVDSFTVTGIVHILSVSGSHISLIAAVMAWLGLIFRLPRKLTAILVIAIIIIYSMLAGLVPPVIRSGIMGALSFAAVALGREKEARRILLITGLVMLLISPLLLFNISFQLSFMATAGLLYIAPNIRKMLERLPLSTAIAMNLAITIAATLSTLPIIAWYFNVLSLSALIANLVVVPIVELIIILGLAAGILALLPLIGSLIFMLDSLLLGIVFELTKILAAIPYSQIYMPSLSLAISMIYYLLLAGLALDKKYLAGRRDKIFLLLAALIVFNVSYNLIKPPVMTMHFIDVGQGDAALAITPQGHAFLFDTGGTLDDFAVGEKVVLPYLRHYGVTRLDGIFLTHAHADHAAGTGSVLQKMPVKAVFTAAEGREEYAKVMGLSTANPLLNKLTTVKQGEVFSLDGLKIEVLFAPQNIKAGNEASNVYRVSYGKASFLITGDITADKEKEMLSSGINAAATVLKAAHHGSDTSNSRELLAAVKPDYGIFSVGKDNSFGHPKAEILERYQNNNIKTYRTDKDGAIIFTTDGEKISVETYENRK